MNASEFEAALKQERYQEIKTRTLEPHPANGGHVHPFSVRGLVTEGEFIVACNGVPRSYTSGDVFEVAAGQRHSEAVGEQGHASLADGNTRIHLAAGPVQGA